MSPKERAAFVRGYRHALRKARRELAEMTQRWDRDLAELDDRMRAAHEQTARSIDDQLNEVRVEAQGLRNAYYRWRAVEAAIAVERDPDELLN